MQTFSFSYYLKIVLAILFGWYLFTYFSDMLSWIVIAWVLSLMGKPIMRWLTKVRIYKYRLPTSARAALTILFFYLIIGSILSMIMPPVISQAKQLSKVDINQVQKSLEAPLAKFNDRLVKWGLLVDEEHKHTTSPPPIARDKSQKPLTIKLDSIMLREGDSVATKNLILNITLPDSSPKEQVVEVHDGHSQMDKIQAQLLDFISPAKLSAAVGGIFGALGNLFVAFASITFITFFFLNDSRLFERILLAIVPDRKERDTSEVIGSIEEMLPRYFEGILLEMAVLMAYLWIMLSIFGIENALLIAFFGALLNVVPYAGPLLGGIFGVFITICSNIEMDFYAHTMHDILFLGGIFITSQWLDNFLLQPLIFSKSVKAHPLEIFLVIIIAAKLVGIMGMVVAVPVYTSLRIIALEFLPHVKWVRKLAGHLNDDAG